ncbi:MAG: TlyA family RNA methyltransferase [bacterium]
MPSSRDKMRLDVLLVERGYADSAEMAARMIRAGQVWLGTGVLDKPGLQIRADAPLEVRGLHDRFVSRGGWKLQAAIDTFPGLTPCPAVCADIGSSTGGFTDCLLQHGARRVHAIDVGAGLIDLKLRNDPRVVLHERCNARHLKPGDLGEPIDLVVSDVSFISLSQILPAAAAILHLSGQAVVLVKPQFEAASRDVEKGGVVRNLSVHRDVLKKVALVFAPESGLYAVGLRLSPVKGPAGNREYLLWLSKDGPARIDADAIDQCVVSIADDMAK